MISDRPTLSVSNHQANSDLSLVDIIDLIAHTLGIQIQPQSQGILKGNILARMKALGLRSIDDYYQYLFIRKRVLSNEAEWKELISLLTVAESYFFRDQGQFWLLRHQILPALIEHKRQQHLRQAAYDQKPSLRLWSAGCSTGEEAYSLAILLRELLPDYQEWELFILGTDINQPSIDLARQGIYSDWSFRAADPAIQNRYFRSHRKGWEIAPEIRDMVTFQLGNLMQDPYPDFTSKIYDLDLILCRNVFIYFDHHAIGRVLDKFYRALSPEGILLTGHTELHGQKIEPFRVKSFPQSVVYQRESLSQHNPDHQLSQTIGGFKAAPLPNLGAASLGAVSLGAASLSEGPGESVNTQHNLLDIAQRSLTQEAYPTAIQTAKQLISLAPRHFQAHCLMAEAYANLGQYAEAIQACQQALLLNSLAIEPYYLLAQIAEEQGDIDSAKLYLKRIIYLAPTSINAHLELSSIYEGEGNVKQAQKIWRSLLEVLQHLPPEQIIDAIEQQTVATLTAHVLKHLGLTTQ